MKRFFCYLTAILIMLSDIFSLSVSVQAKSKKQAEFDPGQLFARSAVLMDADSGRILA